AFDVVEDTLRRLAAALAIVVQRNARPWESATLAYDRLQAARALDRLVALLVVHVELAAMARRQAETIRDPLAMIEAVQVTVWADGWATAGDVLAGAAPEMAVTDSDDGLGPVHLLADVGLVAVCGQDKPRNSVIGRELFGDEEAARCPACVVALALALAPRPMLACDEPPPCLAGGVTTRADVAPSGAMLRALADAGEL